MTLSTFINTPQSKKPHYLLFGHPVAHSLSPLMHNTALDYYNLEGHFYAIDLQADELTKLAFHLNRRSFKGANITIPYKQFVIEYLDELDEVAGKIGAVNTIVKKQNRLWGYNTDYVGFSLPLKQLNEDFGGRRALIFGTGGASRAVVAALQELGFEELFLVSRSPQKNHSFEPFRNVQIISYDQWPAMADEARLMVNATPLGMDPKVNESPVRKGEMPHLSDKICYDIVYNPVETTFLSQAKQAGAQTISGLEMFVQQGSKAFKMWTGKPFPIPLIKEKLHEEFNK